MGWCHPLGLAAHRTRRIAHGALDTAHSTPIVGPLRGTQALEKKKRETATRRSMEMGHKNTGRGASEGYMAWLENPEQNPQTGPYAPESFSG